MLSALVHEVRDLRQSVTAATQHRQPRPYRPHVPNVKRLIRSKPFRKELYPLFIQAGGTVKQWAQLLKSQLPPETMEQAAQWEMEEWKAFMTDQARQWQAMSPTQLGQPDLPLPVGETRDEHEEQSDLLIAEEGSDAGA